MRCKPINALTSSPIASFLRVKLMEVVQRKSRDLGRPQLLDSPMEGVYVDFVKQTRIVSPAQLDKMEKRAAAELWEGLVLRKDAPYVGARVYVTR